MVFNMLPGDVKVFLENFLTQCGSNIFKIPFGNVADFLERNGLFERQLKHLKRGMFKKVAEEHFMKLITALNTQNEREIRRIVFEFMDRSGLLDFVQDILKDFKNFIPVILQEERFVKFMTAVKTRNAEEVAKFTKEFLEQFGLTGQVQDRMKDLKQVIEFLQMVVIAVSPSPTLHSSSMAGNLEEVASSIETGSDIDGKDGTGKTPLHYASQSGRMKVAKLLLEKGAKYNVDSGTEETALHLARSLEMRKLLTTVKTLFEDARIGNGEKVLQHISEESCLVNIKDKNGYTVLHWTALDGHKAIVKLLLEFGADATLVSNKSNSPLHIAASKGHAEIVELLLKSVGRDKLHDFVNAQTETGGNTPLHVAAERGYIDTVKLLLIHGAICSNRNKEGKTPLELTKDWNCTNLLKLIEELFRDAKKGSAEIISKLRNVEPTDLVAVSKARDAGNFTLMQVAFNAKHHNLARMLVKVLKDNYLN